MPSFFLDDREIAFRGGQTVLEAALAAGRHIPHLCWHPDLEPHSSCRTCTVLIDGRPFASCTQPAMEGQRVESDSAELEELRRGIVQMLFVEGNHYCPSCEKSGGCRLQSTAYALGMTEGHFPHQYPVRRADFSHPDVFLDRDRCIRCELCVRASRTLDRKDVFAISGRGLDWTLCVNSPSGLLVDSAVAAGDAAVRLCPTGALMPKSGAFAQPIGQRAHERETLSAIEIADFQARERDRG